MSTKPEEVKKESKEVVVPEKTKGVALQTEYMKAVENTIASYIQSGKLHLPADYSAENALKSAWLIIQDTEDKNHKPALDVCGSKSVINALLHMVILGLNPDKDQCYFIVYGDQLACQRSYFGSIALIKRVAAAKDPIVEIIYEGDKFGYEIKKGRKTNPVHVQDFTAIDIKKIVGAYCVLEFTDGKADYLEVMTLEQIQAAWKMGKLYKDEKSDTFHNKFTDQGCKKTIINRACKAYINGSSDDHLLLEALNNTEQIVIEEELQEEMKQLANKEPIDIEKEQNGEGKPEANGKEKEAPGPGY